MAKRGQATEQNQKQDQETQPEENRLPVPAEPARTIKESTGVTDVNPEDIPKSVPYDESGDSELGPLNDDI